MIKSFVIKQIASYKKIIRKLLTPKIKSANMTNLLIALVNITKNPVTDLIAFYGGSNRANNMGEALETYIKDVFCESFNKPNQEKDKIYSQNFSYLGNQNNPPDFIIKDGDAIEVKKIESSSSDIALNSSYPKDRLHIDDSRVTNVCKVCEAPNSWKEKDIVYVVGVVSKGDNRLKSIWFVYGTCYAADREVYERISDKISKGIREIPEVELVDTNELAKVKKVDPLGVTDLRVRGMWHIKNPAKVFSDFVAVGKAEKFAVNAILLEEKYNSFPEKDRKMLESLQGKNLKINNIQIRSPNNPAKLLEAKLISYTI